MTQQTIQDLINGVYPGLAMLAGMQLDVFTPLNNQPMTAEELAQALDVGATKLRPLLDNLVVAGLLIQDEGRYANSAAAGQFLVRGQPDYMGAMQGQLARFWSGILKTAESIRTGTAQDRVDFANFTPEAAETFFRQLHPGNVATGRELARIIHQPEKLTKRERFGVQDDAQSNRMFRNQAYWVVLGLYKSMSWWP